jgi:hypothetical protein
MDFETVVCLAEFEQMITEQGDMVIFWSFGHLGRGGIGI